MTSTSTKADADFRTYLRDELARRCRSNPRYSLRSFSKFLKIESSALSKILRGKRKISRPMFERMSDRLGFKSTQVRQFLESGTSVQAAYEVLNHEIFTIISDWYHFAILELTTTQDFQGNAKWIASKLGISQVEATMAIERLQSVGALKISTDGTWRDAWGSVTTAGSEVTSPALRKRQRQILELALRALDEVPAESRDQSAMTIPIDRGDLDLAREEFKKFRRNLEKKLKTPKPNAVYELSMSFFPLTKFEEVNSKER